MKKILVYLAAMAAVAAIAISCQKENRVPDEKNPDNTDIVKEGLVFSAQAPVLDNGEAASVQAATRTTIENGVGTQRIVKWAAGDEVEIWWADDAHDTVIADAAGDNTDFTLAADPGAATDFYASYPAAAISAVDIAGEEITVSVPSTQGGTFAAANIAVAKTVKPSMSFQFYNATALVKFVVSDAAYTKAVFKGAKGENIAGDATVTFTGSGIAVDASAADQKEVTVNLSGAGEYYFAILPTTFTDGFSITLYKGEVADAPAFIASSKALNKATLLNMGNIGGVSWKDFFVTPAGAGSKNGKSWDNAMGTAELKAFIEQPVNGGGVQIDAEDYYKAEILDGATIHMAEGDYYLAGAASGRVKVEFTGYAHPVEITFRGGYPAGKTGTDVAGWVMPTAEEADPTNCTAFTGNDEAGIFVFGNQTNIAFEGVTFKNGHFEGANNASLRVEAGDTGNSTVNLSYCRFVDNANQKANYSGAGLAFGKGSSTIDHCYFGNNEARNAAAVNIGSGDGTVTITNCLFKGNSTGNTSGAVQNGSAKTVTLTECVFQDNEAGSYGGGAFHTNGTGASTTFNTCTFTGNSASKGGAISIQTGSATFTNCTFTNNEASFGPKKDSNDSDEDVLAAYAGGAIILHNANSVCTLNNCTFSGNSAPNGSGGAIAFENCAATLNINAGTSFSNCTAYNLGGVIFAGKGNITIAGTSVSNVTFTGCKTLATGNQHANGGALWLGDNTATSMTYAVFTNCEAGQEDGGTVNYSNGGAIRMKAVKSFSASNCEFTGCRGRNGMCLSFELGSKTATFTDCNFHGNIGRSGASKDGTAGNFHGGAAQLGSGTIVFTRCDFTDNVAYHGSGAVHMNGANTTSTFTDCNFTRNSCLNGEAGCIQVESTGLAQVDGCTFTNNSIVSGSTVRNGAVFYLKVAGSNLKATGCTFTGNKITGSGNAYGGVVRAQDNSAIEFDDCLFDGNGNVSGGTIYSGGCIALNQNAHLKVNNCLFKNNVAKSRGAAIQGGTNVIVYLNNVSFYNNTTTNSGGWGVNTHFGNANVCMNNVTSYNNRTTNGTPGNCVSFNGDGGWLVVNSTIIDGTPTAVVRRGGNSRKSIYCNNVLINTDTANNVWAMNSATNFSSAGHNVLSTSGTYNNAAPAASDLLSQTSLSSGAYSEHWNVNPHYAVYTWTNSLAGFTPAVQKDVTDAIDAYTETDSVHTGITSIGADFKTWLESLDPDGYTVDGRNIAREGDWWPGAYQD